MTLLLEIAADRRLLGGVLGALGVVVGSFLPWAHVSIAVAELQETGIEAQGKVAVVLGAIALGLVCAHALLRQADLAIGAGILALLCFGLAIWYQVTLLDAGSRAVRRIVPIIGEFRARGGIGVWVTAAGAAACATACAMLALGARRAQPIEDRPASSRP